MDLTCFRRALFGAALSVLCASAAIVGAPQVRAAELTIADIVNLFIALDIIAPDKVDAARALAAQHGSAGGTGSTGGGVVCMPSQGPRIMLGSRGTEVATLQRALAADRSLYPEGAVSGYFDAATERAVQRFQAQSGIVTSGTPATTGYGAVGAQTRAGLVRMCIARPTVDLTIDGSDGPLSRPGGSYATFSWHSTNADYCTASGNAVTALGATSWNGRKGVSGSESILVGDEKTGVASYTLTCGASSGKVPPAVDSVTVNFVDDSVTPPPYKGPIIYSVDPSTVPLDGETRVTFTGKNFAPDAYVGVDGASVDRITPTKVALDGSSLRFLLPKDADYKDSITAYVVNPDMPIDTSVRNSVVLKIVDARPVTVTVSDTTIRSGEGVTYKIQINNPQVTDLTLTTLCPSDRSTVEAKASFGCGEKTRISVRENPFLWREWYTDPVGGTFYFDVVAFGSDQERIGTTERTKVTVLPSDTRDGVLEVTADSVSFDRIVNENRVGDDEQFYFEVKNPTNQTLSYQIAFDGEQPAWINTGYTKEVLHVDPKGVMGMGVSVDHTGLPVGIYRAAMLLAGDFAESPVRIPIKLNVREDTSATMRAVPDHLTFSSTPTGYYPSQTQGLKLINKTGHTAAYQVRVESGTGLFAVGFSRSSLSALTMVMPTLRAGEEVVIPVTAHATGLAYGKYTGSVVVTGEFVNTPIRVPIVLWVSDGMKG